MKSFKIALWVSCLALTGLLASCGAGNVGSPIQDDLNATAAGSPGDSMDQAVPVVEDEAGNKDVSYLPGGFAWCYSGIAVKVNHHFFYTDRWGDPRESSVGGVDTLHLRSSSTTVAGVRYWFKRGPNVLPGERIHRLEFHGTGKNMQVRLYNYDTGVYTAWTTFNLDDAPMLGYWPFVNVAANQVDANGRVICEVRSKLLSYNKLTSIRSDVY